MYVVWKENADEGRSRLVKVIEIQRFSIAETDEDTHPARYGKPDQRLGRAAKEGRKGDESCEKKGERLYKASAEPSAFCIAWLHFRLDDLA